MASKARPGPHRDKREAKKEAKASKFRGVEHAVKNKAGVMAKPVNLVRYDMSDFLGSCVENYCNLAKVSPSSLKEVPTPFTDAGIARPTLSEDEKPGKLQPVASKILMKILFAARMARFDLLRATQSLASRVTKWSIECDVALHRLVSYIHCTKHHFLEGFIGDAFDECQLWLFADADHAGEHDSKSTTGSAIVLVGPNTYYPLNAFSKKQTVVAISSTEAEVVAANHSMRAEGIPMLALFEQLNLFKKLQGKPARDAAKPQEDVVFTRIDPEIDEIRNGNVDTGCSVADINSLKASFPEFYQVKFMEDNQATITVMSTGSSASMRHMNKTQNINFKWLKQQFECKQFDLLNVGTSFQVADILTKPFTRPALWLHAIHLIGIGPTKVEEAAARHTAAPNSTKVPKLATAAGNQGGSQKSFKPRMLIEFCCSDDSKLSTPRKSNEDCHCIRVTEKDDGTTNSCRQRLASQVQDFRNDFNDGTLILYASLPCVGGSPWGNVNGLTVEGQERIKEQQKQFTKLFKSFVKLVDEVYDERTLIAFELSKNCKYWRWPMVRRFLKERSMTTHHFDGCMLGVLGNNGQPMKKSWTIAGNFKELTVLDSFKCDGKHEHDQSRGRALKLAENYTFKLTDMLHECFRVAVVGQTSKRISPVVIRACPAKMADSRYATAHPASREAALEATREANKEAWLLLHNRILYALAMRNEGENQAAQDLVDGLMTEWTPASALRFYGREDPLAEYLSFCFLPKESHIEKIMLPEMPVNDVIWILVSDSSCALITGRRKTLKKFDLSEHYRQRKPKYVTEFIHEMLWGKTLQRLVKRGIELAADARERYPHARINLHLSWFGNELVGEDGIAQNPNWPYDGPNGHWPTILDDCERHLTWFINKARELDLQTAGLTTAPWSADYGIHPIFDQFFDHLEPRFKALTSSLQGRANPRYPWLKAKGYADAMEFRDQWHFANSEENRTRLAAYWTATLFALDSGWRVGQIGLELSECAQETWDDLRRNMSAVLDELPRSYQETCANITKLLFGESRRHIVPTGRSFTKEDVEAQQPDTEDYIDIKTMPSGTFAEPPKDDPPKAAGDGEPAASSRATILVQTAEVMLKSRPKAAPASMDEPADDKGATSSQYQPQATARFEGQASGHVKAYWMEEHLPEYQYTMVTNADGDDVPGILFEGTAYELELISASDVETIASQTRVDKKFSDFATRVNKVCRGHGSCAKVPMDKDLWIDLEDFAKAFRKEVPPDVFITVANLFGTAMKIDKHGKSRFQFLCAKISHFPVDNGLGMPYYPVKIRAIQGHSEAALKTAGGLYANSTMVYCSDHVSPERKAAFTGVPLCAMTEVPEVVFHRTMKSSWKSIAQNGLIPGGGATVNSGRAHIYMAEHCIGTQGYRSGLRAKCPIEVKIAMRQAVEAGVIFSRTEMDGILCSERIPPQFLVSISEEGQVLWSRAESNLEPSTWTGAASASAPKAKAVTLTARDDANDDPMDDTSTGRPDAKSTDDDEATASMQVDQPPARTRRVYIAPKYCEPFMGSCPLCQVEYVSGQVTCTTCGFEPLPVDESGDTKEANKPNRRTRILERRMQSLAGFGMFGKMSGSLLTALTEEQANLLRRELGLKDCRDRHRRAKALGYEDVEDRYSSDVTFCDRIHGEGKDLQDCIFDDMFAYGNLPDPQGPKLRSRLASPPMPKMRTAYLSWFSCLSLVALMASQLSSAKHGRRSGVSCLAATFLQRMNMSATSAVVAHSVACWPGRVLSKSLLMALVISSKRCMRKTFPWFGAILNAKRSRAPLQRLEVLEVIRPTPRSRPPLSESAKPKLMPTPETPFSACTIVITIPTPRGIRATGACSLRSDSCGCCFCSGRCLRLQEWSCSCFGCWWFGYQKWCGWGISVRGICASRAWGGCDICCGCGWLGITVTRPAAVGSFGTVRETMIFFCSIAQDVAW